MLDDHYRSVRHVHADFHNRSANKDLRFVLVEALHDLVFFFAGEPPMQQAELLLGKNLFRETLILVDGGFQFELRFFNDRINDVRLAPRGDFAPKRFPNAGKVRLSCYTRNDGRTSGGQLVQYRNVEVTIERQRERSWNGRSCQHEHMWSVAVRSGFVHQTLALQDSEAVLLVNRHKSEPRESHVLFNQRVRADDQLRLSRANTSQRSLFVQIG